MAKFRIRNSYVVPKKDFIPFLDSYDFPEANKVKSIRGFRSLCREWSAHNFLYSLGIARNKTKDCDFEAPIKWYAELGYFLLGWCRVFIK